LFFNGSMELHVAEIIIILLDVVKQLVRFILFLYFKYGAKMNKILNQ